LSPSPRCMQMNTDEYQRQAQIMSGVPRSSMRCHTPSCSFLVHSDAQFGGYCCCACFFRFKKTLSKRARKHGELCEGRVARQLDPVAPDAAPHWYVPGYLATHSQPGSSSGTSYLGATRFLAQQQAVHDGGGLQLHLPHREGMPAAGPPHGPTDAPGNPSVDQQYGQTAPAGHEECCFNGAGTEAPAACKCPGCIYDAETRTGYCQQCRPTKFRPPECGCSCYGCKSAAGGRWFLAALRRGPVVWDPPLPASWDSPTAYAVPGGPAASSMGATQTAHTNPMNT